MAEGRDKEELKVAEFHKRIKDAFEVFDHELNNTVDVREIGTIVRSLGCCPSEGELHDLLAEVEEEEPTGYIRYEKFLPVMTKVLLEGRYRPIPDDVLLQAFETLDSAKRGFLTKEELIKYMTEEGAGRCSKWRLWWFSWWMMSWTPALQIQQPSPLCWGQLRSFLYHR
ncbi:dynein regulatory complex protein 8 isoform X1 [Cavia porcellus]|uniref:dynein regulatory complex protein 8 isoform X1 n=1 Tax=Cavia porcellus TaxID=10141 RepID=UPI002FE01B88